MSNLITTDQLWLGDLWLPFFVVSSCGWVGPGFAPKVCVFRGGFVDLPSLTSWVSSHHLWTTQLFLASKNQGIPQHRLEGRYNWCCQALVASKGKRGQTNRENPPLGFRTTNAAASKGGESAGRESAKPRSEKNKKTTWKCHIFVENLWKPPKVIEKSSNQGMFF